jgi:hypothetical protein
MRSKRTTAFCIAACLAGTSLVRAQTDGSDFLGTHILGSLSERTVLETEKYRPISNREKITIAAKDSFGTPILFQSALCAGLLQWSGEDHSYGQGGRGYGIRVAANYGDKMISNMTREGLLSVLLHQDPRFFRKGPGESVTSRLGYAMSRVVITRNDSGQSAFNYSGIAGEATAVGISTTYHPDYQTARDAVTSLGVRLGIHAGSFILAEFWPDIRSKFFHGNRHEP